MHQFEQHLLRAIGGKYSFEDGVSIASDINADWVDWRATEKHECIHSELTDMSVYGWFQRIMFTLKNSPSVPMENTMIYKRVFSEMLQHCFSVHEGIASYRELLWYTAYTKNAKVAQQHLPDDYRKAFELVSSIMPKNMAEDRAMQPAYHAICDILGTYLLDAPLSCYYSDFNLLKKEELRYINFEGPDFRLKKLTWHPNVISPILQKALLLGAQIIDKDFREQGFLGKNTYWAFFNNTIKQLGQAVPSLPICNPHEKQLLMHKLIEKWQKQIQHPYASALQHSKRKDVRDVTKQRIKDVKFQTLNAGDIEDCYDEQLLDSPLEYVGTVADISSRGNIAFMICVCNPSAVSIPLVHNETLPADTIHGLFFEVPGPRRPARHRLSK